MTRAMANRGRSLEQAIALSCATYRQQGLAVVDKIPTPWVPQRGAGGRITGAHPASKSTVDFVGCLAPHGQLVAFDAKQNHTATRFDFDPRWGHEVEFIRAVMAAGGIGFILVEQVSQSRVYLVPGRELLRLWDKAMRGGRKSIPLSVLESFPVVGHSAGAPVDWLTTITEEEAL